MEPFVERAGCLDRLLAWTASTAATGGGGLVLVTGEAGAGKTRLCTELSRSLAHAEVAVAWSRCGVVDTGPPLSPWPDLVAELAYQQGHEPAPDLRTDRAARDRFELFQSVADRLRALCRDRPSVALLDDLHAAGDDALLLTQFLTGVLHRFPLLVVATWRLERVPTVEASARLATLTREARTIDLLPFAERDVAAYLRLAGSRHDAETVSRLFQATDGNPMYLAELVRYPPDGPDSGRSGLARALSRRVARLGAAQRRAVAVAALLGDGSTVSEVATVAGMEAHEVTAAINDMASGARLVDGRVRLSHDLLRDVFLGALSDEERVRHHRAAVEAIGGDCVELNVRRARHAVAAAAMCDAHRRDAVVACHAAARSLHQSLAFESAAHWALTGSDLADAGTPADIRAELLLAEASAISAAGRLSDARDRCDKAVALALRSGDPRLLARAALGLGGVWVEEQRGEVPRRMIGLCRQALDRLPDDEQLVAARLRVRLTAEYADHGGADHRRRGRR